MAASRRWSIQVVMSGGKPAQVSFCYRQDIAGWRCEQMDETEVKELIEALEDALSFIDRHGGTA